MSTTNISNSYIDFLGTSALQYSAKFDRPYRNDICVYALSGIRDTRDSTKINSNSISKIVDRRLNQIDWTDCDFNFAKSTSASYMCYHFKTSDITTESDTEPDTPYSYEELFNTCVLNNMYNSTAMQYKYIYSAYNTMQDEYIQPLHKYTDALLLNNFKVTNNLASDREFVRSDYYKFFVSETDVIHSRSVLELTDDTNASVSNRTHASFNCLLYCINPYFDEKIYEDETIPRGFTDTDYNVIPISLCTFSDDIILAGNNIVFEPNLNGIVTVE